MGWSMTEVSVLAAILLVFVSFIIRAANRVSLEAAGPSNSRKLDSFLCFAGLFIRVFLGAKLYLIHSYGSDVPFWDEWDGTPLFYPQIFRGTLNPAALFQPHNEHRVLFMRLVNLTIVALNGEWDRCWKWR